MASQARFSLIGEGTPFLKSKSFSRFHRVTSMFSYVSYWREVGNFLIILFFRTSTSTIQKWKSMHLIIKTLTCQEQGDQEYCREVAIAYVISRFGMVSMEDRMSIMNPGLYSGSCSCGKISKYYNRNKIENYDLNINHYQTLIISPISP